MRSPGEIVSLVMTEEEEVQMICYNQAEDTITTIHNYGHIEASDENYYDE